MPGHRDITGATHERGTVRMSFRTKPRIKETIQRAAALLDGDDFVFTMNAAYKAAMETISAHEHTMPGPSIMRRSLPRSTVRQHRPTGSVRHSRATARPSKAGERQKRRRQHASPGLSAGAARSAPAPH